MGAENSKIDVRLSAHDQAVRLMASWISAIADQVKNPVAGISAAAGLIEREMTSFRASRQWDPAIVEEAVRLMLERLSRFDNYLAELSGFTRAVTVESRWVDLAIEWPSIEQFLARRIQVDFRVRWRSPQKGHSVVFADLERFKAILAAVVLNAVEACGASLSPEILVELEAVSPERSGLAGTLMTVRDNGPGFTEDALIQGMVPFFTTKEAGTGLGLAMVEKYVRAHGGWVKISNAPQGGGVVEMFFPSPQEIKGQER